MRKGKVLQRMIAALLSAVLITGMVSSAVPMTVLAQEPGEAQESVSGNSAETAEGDITSEDGTEQKPANPKIRKKPGRKARKRTHRGSRTADRKRQMRVQRKTKGRRPRYRAWRERQSREPSAEMMLRRRL